MPMPPPDPWLAARDPYACVLDPTPIGVYRVNDDPTASPAQALQPLTTLECLHVKWPGGAEPKTCTLRYRLGDPGNGPHSIEDALSTLTPAAGVLRPNDRVVVLAFFPDGTSIPLFDGDPVRFTGQIEGDEHGGTEDAVIHCVGIERRAQDLPMPGMFARDGDQPDVVSDVQTAIPAVFNPRGKPNGTPLGADHTNDAGDPYPTFLDPKISGATFWTLPRAVAYLIYHHNDIEEYVSNPERLVLDTVLVARLPKDDGTTFNPNDPASYIAKDIIAPNTPITGRDWPKTLEAMIAGKGFLSTYRLDGSGPGRVPRTRLDIQYWQAGDPRVILLQPEGSDLDGTLSNVGGCQITRDINEVVTAIEVRGHAHRWQAQFVLECGFPMDPADSTEAGIAQFSTTATGGAPGDGYRLYVFGETGDGYYRPTTATRITAVPSLDVLFGPPDARGNRQYAKRRRPGSHKLLPVAASVPAARAILEYSIDYGGAAPAVYGAPGATGGTWYPIHGGFQVLDDRLGIRFTVNNPNQINVGRAGGLVDDVLHGVEAQALNDPSNPAFHLRLTTVIEADDAVLGGAVPRPTAITSRTITRQVDARDRYFLDRTYNPGSSPTILRDDTEAATDEAIAHRDALDAGQLDGPVTIPRFTAPPTYDIGHRITQLYGRNLGFRTDGGSASEYPTYPIIRAMEWHFSDDRQETLLHISDSADNAPRKRRKAAAHGATAPRSLGSSIPAAIPNAGDILRAGRGD